MTATLDLRTGNCAVRSWLATPDGNPLPRDHRDQVQHGTMRWVEFLADMTAAGATNPAYDLYEIAQPDGLLRVYRVVDEGHQP